MLALDMPFPENYDTALLVSGAVSTLRTLISGSAYSLKWSGSAECYITRDGSNPTGVAGSGSATGVIFQNGEGVEYFIAGSGSQVLKAVSPGAGRVQILRQSRGVIPSGR